MKCFDEYELNLLKQVIESQYLAMDYGGGGDFITQLENEFAEYIGVKYGLAVNGGTSALEAACAAVGIGPNQEVICTGYSFIASSMAALTCNGIPVFADVDPRTLCLDPEDIRRKISKRTSAIIIVHILGQPCQMDEIMAIAKEHNLWVIEDACQAMGAIYKGKRVGTIGHIGCFSLQSSKAITCGEGGLLVTNDEELCRRAYQHTRNGMSFNPRRNDYSLRHQTFGSNLRMTDLQAAVALAQLKKLDQFNNRRRQFARIIEEGLNAISGLLLPHVYTETDPIYWKYPIRYDAEKAGMSIDEFHRHAAEAGYNFSCETRIPNYLEPVFVTGAYKKDYPPGCRWHPDNPEYGPGLCPNLESVIPKKFFMFWMHHNQEPEKIEEEVSFIRDLLAQ